MQPTAIIARLKHAREHSLDIEEIAHARKELARLGGAAIVPLLSAVAQGLLPVKLVREIVHDIGPSLNAEEKPPLLAAAQYHAEQARDVASRVLALELIAEHIDSAVYGGHSMLPMARDPLVPQEVRSQALRAMARARLDQTGLSSLLDLVMAHEPEVALAALSAVEAQAKNIDAAKASEVLTKLLLSMQGEVRRRAIELLGVFGEVDLVERICALPLSDPQGIDAVQGMVRRVLNKPRSLHHISPTSFEHLIMRLLLAMNFELVKVTGGVRDDGIDLTAIREESDGALKKERRFYIVQCKRHRSPIGPQMIQEFIMTLQGREGARGLFIATSQFTPQARQATGAYRLELVDRDELQQHLDRHFGVNQYRAAAVG